MAKGEICGDGKAMVKGEPPGIRTTPRAPSIIFFKITFHWQVKNPGARVSKIPPLQTEPTTTLPRVGEHRSHDWAFHWRRELETQPPGLETQPRARSVAATGRVSVAMSWISQPPVWKHSRGPDRHHSWPGLSIGAGKASPRSGNTAGARTVTTPGRVCR